MIESESFETVAFFQAAGLLQTTRWRLWHLCFCCSSLASSLRLLQTPLHLNFSLWSLSPILVTRQSSLRYIWYLGSAHIWMEGDSVPRPPGCWPVLCTRPGRFLQPERSLQSCSRFCSPVWHIRSTLFLWLCLRQPSIKKLTKPCLPSNSQPSRSDQ